MGSFPMAVRALGSLGAALVLITLAGEPDALGRRRVEVPRTAEATVEAGRAAAPELVAKYEGMPRTADPALEPILRELQALAPGSADPKAEALLKDFMVLSTSSPASAAEALELRTLYDNTYTPLMSAWQEQLQVEKVPLEDRAKLAVLHRTSLRELTRDLMRDDNAVAILRARDRVKYGQEAGPTYDQLYAREMGKPGATPELAWSGIIGSSQRHNKDVSDAAKGN